MEETLPQSLIIREDWILKRCAGKRVLHLGCSDYPLTTIKGDRGALLHQRLAEVAAHLIGVDVSSEGLRILHLNYGFDNLHIHNVEELNTIELTEPIDVVVAGEIVEHLDNIGLFFEACKSLLEQRGGTVLVAVPNALSIKRIVASLVKRNENVHPDHVCYLSPSTMSEVARRHKMHTVEMRMYMWRNPTLENRMGNMISQTLIRVFRAPLLADGVAAEYFTGQPDVV